jgi:hypothetical protein
LRTEFAPAVASCGGGVEEEEEEEEEEEDFLSMLA